jgi:type II secretory ATPase GspE/PulE/Tfp pilus assembly ATPase PilB-like protein
MSIQTAVAAVSRMLALNVDANSIASSLMGVPGQRWCGGRARLSRRVRAARRSPR